MSAQYVPKGERERDHESVIRRPSETRPLGLRNTDIKLLAKAWSRRLRPLLRQYICAAQRGFVWTRNLCQNIVDLDAYAYKIGVPSRRPDFPIIALFDIRSAFTSMAHKWIFHVHQQANFPDTYMYFLHALYHMATVVDYHEGNQYIAYYILSGAIQGCPSSGDVWAISFDPYINMLVEKIEAPSRGIIRACADDIGAALRTIYVLHVFHAVCDLDSGLWK